MMSLIYKKIARTGMAARTFLVDVRNMAKDLYELLRIMDKEIAKSFFSMLGLTVVFVLVDFAGIISIVPFLGIVANPELFQEKMWMIRISEFFGSPPLHWLSFYLGLLSFSILLIRHIVFYYAELYSLFLSQKMKHGFFALLFNYYMHRDYALHLQEHNIMLHQNAENKARELCGMWLLGLINLIKSIIFFMVGLSVLLIQDPLLALLGVGGMGVIILSYTIFYNKRLAELTFLDQEARAVNTVIAIDGLGIVEDIKIHHKEQSYLEYLLNRMIETLRRDREMAGMSLLLTPLLESALLGIVVLTIGIYAWQGSVTTDITDLAIFALVSYRTLPYYRSFYKHFVEMIRGRVQYQVIRPDIINASKFKIQERSKKLLTAWREISFNGLSYQYAKSKEYALKDVDFKIVAGTAVGICGISGSGKSTLIRLLLGLLRPNKGSISIDGVALIGEKLDSWQNTLSYVSQNICLTDTDIAHNVSFTMPDEEIDHTRVKQAITMANLDTLIESLPKGIYSMVGENAKRISGGQRQRLAIARALYRQSNVLILDEGTSTLDTKTERIIIDNILNDDTKDKKTLIMVAHRINTIRHCDVIYVLRDGGIVDHGSYTELFERSKYFRELTGE